MLTKHHKISLEKSQILSQYFTLTAETEHSSLNDREYKCKLCEKTWKYTNHKEVFAYHLLNAHKISIEVTQPQLINIRTISFDLKKLLEDKRDHELVMMLVSNH